MELAIRQALETWYEPDHPLHNDSLHPAIGLAGEAGEILDLYKKEQFKDGVSWWDCVHCGKDKNKHLDNGECYDGIVIPKSFRYKYTPKILDELGDFWYYLRILAWQQNKELNHSEQKEIPNILSRLNYACATFLDDILNRRLIDTSRLQLAYGYLLALLVKLDLTLDQVTEANYQKLCKADNHGWKKARLSRKED